MCVPARVSNRGKGLSSALGGSHHAQSLRVSEREEMERKMAQGNLPLERPALIRPSLVASRQLALAFPQIIRTRRDQPGGSASPSPNATGLSEKLSKFWGAESAGFPKVAQVVGQTHDLRSQSARSSSASPAVGPANRRTGRPGARARPADSQALARSPGRADLWWRRLGKGAVGALAEGSGGGRAAGRKTPRRWREAGASSSPLSSPAAQLGARAAANL